MRRYASKAVKADQLRLCFWVSTRLGESPGLFKGHLFLTFSTKDPEQGYIMHVLALATIYTHIVQRTAPWFYDNDILYHGGCDGATPLTMNIIKNA